MSTYSIPDFTIQRLGAARYESPLPLSDVPNDHIGDFVREDERVIYDPNMEEVQRALAEGREPLSLEVAGPRHKLFFEPGKARAAVVTCGGLCPGINDVIRALTLCLWHHYRIRDIFGARYGYWGLTPENFGEAMRLDPDVVDHIHHEGGTILRSSRGPQDVARMVDTLERNRIDMLFTIGGDGTQRGALAIAQEIGQRGLPIAVVGVPKTIDNDICHTERTFGFETAFSIARDILVGAHTEARCAMNGVGLVKLMGRRSGYITARAALASGEANFVLIPEAPFDLDGPRGFLAALEARLRDRKHALVVVAEGAGQDMLQEEAARLETDRSGNVALADIGLYLKRRIEQYLAARDMDFTVKYIDPSYIIRSLPANASDAVFCQELARAAVHAAMTGRTGMIVGYWNQHYTHVPIAPAIGSRKAIDTDGPEWRAVMEATGQPPTMKN
ncbi:MAG: ATP-dependent 6-phosphofructokinase [Candidatus Sumerlaeota bacterium]|nr:ATP-dependent 6-phosphofructokinase [Candidatus Sumerlaeota bacterium]